MSTKKKALLIIQGISTTREYMKLDTPIIAAYAAKYDSIEYMYTEDIFDKGWFSKMFDKLDFIPYFLNKKKRLEVCRLVNDKVASFEVLGYQVDILAHSLGCIIAMQCGRQKIPVNVNKLVALQSPTNSKIYGWYVRGQVLKYSDSIKINKLIVTWNKDDKAVANTEIDLHKMVKKFKGVVKTAFQYELGKGHDWKRPFKSLIAGGKI